MIKIYSNFEKNISTHLKLTFMCIVTICTSIMLSSCQKNTIDEDPPTSGRTQLPVVFHVIYKNQGKAMQYVSASRLRTILNNINKIYSESTGSVDMGVEFVLASTAPQGKRLAAAGVEYVNWTEEFPGEAYPINCTNLMVDDTGKYIGLLWDPNKYINVLVYNFQSNDSGFTTLGVAHLPIVSQGKNAIGGLSEASQVVSYITLDNINYAHCISINSLFINSESTSTSYNSGDINITLAHELGHHLGLHHAFAEDNNGISNSTTDSDYCLDTPSYNRIAYLNNRASLQEHEYQFATLVERQNESGKFIAHNIMDYEVCYSDQFSSDQRARINYVLSNALLLPKTGKSADPSRAIKGIIDVPIRAIE